MFIVSGRKVWAHIAAARRFSAFWSCLLLLNFVVAGPPLSADEPALTDLIRGATPTSISDLRAMQTQIQSVADQVIPTTVAVRVGSAHGSGVIISSDGYVLTAAHVAGKPQRKARLILHDGRRVSGVTLGVYRTIDAGLVKITTPSGVDGEAKWPHAEFGDSDELVAGQWCLATGHPGGFQEGRPPVVRVGRIQSVGEDALNTDCTLIGGDSGGPLFDLEGQVIGIHSRIGGPLTVNLHVPVNSYRATWERLVAGEAWGRLPGSEPYIGVQGEAEAEMARIVRVFEGSPAETAGVLPGDIVVALGGHPVTNFDSLRRLVRDNEPGTTRVIEVIRDEQRLQLDLIIGDRRG